MHIYQPADPQPCYYCKKIEDFEDGYPIREGVFTAEHMVFRCPWHAKFQCSKCEKFHHFSWLYFCPKTKKLICGNCNKPTLKPVRFWNKNYAYDFWCDQCESSHYDLLYTEFRGKHPWQLEEENIISNVEIQTPWKPYWRPLYSRKGKEISLEESLKIEDNVAPIRKMRGSVVFHTELIPEDQVKHQETLEKWERDSGIWLEIYRKQSESDEGDINRQLIIDPALWELLGDVRKLKVLDAGCGNGYLSRELSRRGAEVVGVDFSEPFIKYCKQQESVEKLGSKFIHASLMDLKEIKDNSFDLVVSNIVMVDVSDFKQAFLEISRVLKTKGRFVWSNLHPVFGRLSSIDLKLPKDTPRNEEVLYKVTDRYFESGGIQISWHNLEPLWSFDRTLSEYSKALKKAGFVIQEIVEPKPSNEVIQQNPRLLAFDANRYPLFIIYDCLKK